MTPTPPSARRGRGRKYPASEDSRGCEPSPPARPEQVLATQQLDDLIRELVRLKHELPEPRVWQLELRERDLDNYATLHKVVERLRRVWRDLQFRSAS